MESLTLTDILHTIGQAMRMPCIVILLLLMVAAVWQIGDVLVEYFIERRKTKENIKELLKELDGMNAQGQRQRIENSSLLKRQKCFLTELIESADMPVSARTALAQKLLDDEVAHYRKNNYVTDMIAKLGPMFGLLGTLIPLGPGIVALGQGDTALLADSLNVAFDTTIAGLLSAAVATIISGVRKRWYASYMSACEALAEVVLGGE